MLTIIFRFADAAALLDWDLEAEVLPFARFMVYLKKAKVSSVVHPKLLGIYAPPATLTTPLDVLAKQFESTFPPTTPSFYTILAAVSSCQQAFSYFVPSLDHVPLWREVLLFFLKNDALVMLHLHFRIIVTGDIKQSVYAAHQRKIEAQKFRAALQHGFEEQRGRKRILPNSTRDRVRDNLYDEELTPVPEQVIGYGIPRESAAGRRRELRSPTLTRGSTARGVAWSEDELRKSTDDELTDDDLQESEEKDVEPDIEIPDDMTMSFINEPREVTGIERLWLEEIAQQRSALKDDFLTWVYLHQSAVWFLKVSFLAWQATLMGAQPLKRYSTGPKSKERGSEILLSNMIHGYVLSVFPLGVGLMTHTAALNASSLTYLAHYRLIKELNHFITNSLQCDSRAYSGLLLFTKRLVVPMTFGGPPHLESTTSSLATLGNTNYATPCTGDWLNRQLEGE